jgi:hypothetical protein
MSKRIELEFSDGGSAIYPPREYDPPRRRRPECVSGLLISAGG